jgi:hypothetical protein
VDTTGNLTSSKEAMNGFAIATKDTGLVVNLESTHGIVEDWLHDSNMKKVVYLKVAAWIVLVTNIL